MNPQAYLRQLMSPVVLHISKSALDAFNCSSFKVSFFTCSTFAVKRPISSLKCLLFVGPK